MKEFRVDLYSEKLKEGKIFRVDAVAAFVMKIASHEEAFSEGVGNECFDGYMIQHYLFPIWVPKKYIEDLLGEIDVPEYDEDIKGEYDFKRLGQEVLRQRNLGISIDKMKIDIEQFKNN
jgi:hypothetical protein